MEKDPYADMDENRLLHIESTLNNSDLVCAVKYDDEDRINYSLQTFENKLEAEESGFTVTH